MLFANIIVVNLVPDYNKSKGQALVLGLGIFVVACLVFFMVFNSGRAVNEKINLVNAADASAYSGAQIAARHLNFMAYTNRAMIANEVAIGHLFSFDKETQLIGKIFSNALGGGGGGLGGVISSIISFFFPALSTAQQFVQPILDVSTAVTGIMTLMLDANNQSFSNFQEQAFFDLVSVNANTGLGLIDETMMAVAASYDIRTNAPISVNDPNMLLLYENNVDPRISGAVQQVRNKQQSLCEMIMFANPGAQTGVALQGAGLQAFCQATISGGLVGNDDGNPGNPTNDGGLMLDAIRQTVNNMDNATWVRDRNLDNYDVELFGVDTGFNATRTGETELRYDSSQGQLNWVADEDRVRFSLLGINFFTDFVDGDAIDTVQQAGAIFDMAALQFLQNIGLCTNGGSVDCASLTNGQYDSIQRYAALNPANQTVDITAFLQQNNCSDSIGFDESENEIQDWNNNLRYLDEAEPFCGKEVFAIGSAQVFYERPDCYQIGNTACANNNVGFAKVGNAARQRENPNLFNPFWQVRLTP
jgi:hypothetical protein